jgi:hypothetical protein
VKICRDEEKVVREERNGNEVAMKLLHIYRSKPTEEVLTLAKILSEENETTDFPLYEGKVDYGQLVDLIFSHDKAVSWW